MSRARDLANAITTPEFSGNVEIIGTSPELTFETTNASHYNFQISVQENISGGLEISSGSADADSSNDTFTPRLVVLQSGNVGIGENDPQQLLHVSANNPGGKIRLEMDQSGVADGDVTGEIQFYHNDSSGAGVNADIKGICTSSVGAGALTFGTGTTSTTERMRIDSSGRVGIGITPDTSSTGKVLQINRSVINDDDNGFVHFTQNAYYNNAWKYVENGTAEKISFATGTIRFDNASSNSGGADASLTWSECMRIDSSGNLIIADTSSAFNDTTKTSIRASGDNYVIKSGVCVAYNRTSGGGDILEFYQGSGSKVGSIGTTGGDVFIASSPSGHKGLRFANGVIFPVTNSGANSDNETDLGVDGARFKDLFLSGGAYIGGTGSANHLDDYEEGTFTPPFLIGGSTAGISVAHQEGKYTKIGNICHVIVRINLSNKGSNSGYVTIGLPFASADTSGQGGVVSFPYTFNFGGNTVDNNISGFCQQNSTSFGLFHQASGSSVAGGDLNNNTQFNFTLTYQTT